MHTGEAVYPVQPGWDTEEGADLMQDKAAAMQCHGAARLELPMGKKKGGYGSDQRMGEEFEWISGCLSICQHL